MPSILNVKFKLNPRCDHLVRTFLAANLLPGTVSICPFIQQVHKKMCLHNLARAKVAFVDFMSLGQISLLLSLTKT